MDIIVKVDAKAVSKRLNELRKKYGDLDKIDVDLHKVGRKMVRNAKRLAPKKKGYLKNSINYSLESKGINQYARNWMLNLFIEEGNKPHDPTDYARMREYGGIQYKKKKPFYMIPIGPFRNKKIRARDVIESPGSFGYRSTWMSTYSQILFGIPRGKKNVEDYDPLFYRTNYIVQPQTPEGGFLTPAADIAVGDVIKVLEKWRID